MKQGRTLTELAMELDRQAKAKADYIAPTSKIHAIAEVDKGERVPALELEGTGAYPVTNHAHGQLASYVEIPKRYYDRMLTDAPELWADSVNKWLPEKRQSRMIRTLDNQVRALLSDSYRKIENYDVAQAVLPVLMQIGEGGRPLVIDSCEVTAAKLYIKAVDPNREEAIEKAFEAKGLMKGAGHGIIDVVSPAITIQNSEVGSGTAAILTSIFIKACTNLAVWEGGELKKYHVGKRADISDEVYALLEDETKARMDEALWLQMRDVTKGAFDEVKFGQRIEKIKAIAENGIEGKVDEVIKRVADTYSLSVEEGENVLDHLIKGGDLTQWGVSNAITRASQDVQSYDRATELEKLGGRVIELPSTDWKRLAA